MPAEPEPDAYKYQWARWLARDRLDSDFQILNKKLSAARHVAPANNINNLALQQNKLTIGQSPETPGKFKVGIVGAGCAGLFTAMIFDYLKSKEIGIDISYDILEASGEERLGGRLYTHRFSKEPQDYYDVGAMRFPENPIMKRTFRLFDLLGLTMKKIPYYLSDDLHCPKYFNDIRTVGKQTSPDPYQINTTFPKRARVPQDLMRKGPDEVLEYAIKDYKDAIKENLEKTMARKRASHSEHEEDPGWKLLMRADFMSTRQYLRSRQNPRTGFNFNTIEWLETFTCATGLFNQALSETVLESLDFDATHWYCLFGGTQQIAVEMAKMLENKPEFHRQVTAIEAHKSSGQMSLTIKSNDKPQTEPEQREYFAVINSTPLGALQRMDLTKANLRYGTKQAIRSLSYDAACKVGIKFKRAWWMDKHLKIKKGGVAYTDLPLRVCVYPSYNLDAYHDPKHPKEAVLLCSYTWSQDAKRIGALISPDSPKHEEELKEVLFHDLALLHATDDRKYDEMLKVIKETYDTHFAYDWYKDPHTSGAYALFGPGQFSSMYPELVKPNGWLFLIGEAASTHHAWIVGALESAVRGVYQLLETLHLKRPEDECYKRAMDCLSEDDGESPFGPLPREMPRRQKGTAKDHEKSNHPKEGAELTFTAAQVILSYLEGVVEAAEQEAK